MRLDQSTSRLMMGRRSFTLKDAQKGRPARPQRAKKRRRTLWGTLELEHDASTKLTGFFSILI
jgi:hypothetical protein